MAYSGLEDMEQLSLGDFCELITDDDLVNWTTGDDGLGAGLNAAAITMEAGLCSAFELCPTASRPLCKHPSDQSLQMVAAVPSCEATQQPMANHSFSPDGSSSPTLGSAASMQQLVLQQGGGSSFGTGAHGPSPGTSMLDDDELDATSHGASGRGSHTSSEKQRRDRLNALIEKLASLVPPSDERYLAPTGSAGLRRPKHVVLLDAIRMLRALQEHVRTCPAAAPAAPGVAGNPSSRSTSLAPAPANVNPGASMQLEFPLPLDIPKHATGVMVEAVPGACVWLLRVTCRDRPGLLCDVAAALRSLPLTIRSASLTTSRDGKAQQVYEVALLDPSLAPEEVQCAVNAALYAHLLAAPAAAAPPAAKCTQAQASASAPAAPVSGPAGSAADAAAPTARQGPPAKRMRSC